MVRTVRGRVGPTITPTILDYVTGGLAYGEVKSTDTVSGINIANPGGQGTNAGTVLTLAAATLATATRGPVGPLAPVLRLRVDGGAS